MKVMVVEDDLLIADMYQQILVSGGHDVCCIARTIASAVACAKAHEPDIALIDVRLGRQEMGTDIPAQLDSRVGILYSTGNSARVTMAGVMGDACLGKPYSSDDLLRALAIVAEMRATKRASLPFPRTFRVLPDASGRLAA